MKQGSIDELKVVIVLLYPTLMRSHLELYVHSSGYHTVKKML